MTRNEMTNKQYNIKNKLGYRPGVDVGNECPRVSRSRMNHKRNDPGFILVHGPYSFREPKPPLCMQCYHSFDDSFGSKAHVRIILRG